MFKKFFIVFAFLFLNSSLALSDMYAIHNMHVDFTADNATSAREQGLNDAQEKAFYKMLERLTLFKDMESLPVLTNEDILNLVQDFSVSNEKTSSVRYIADVDVQFDPQAIQTFFQEYQVPYVTSVAEKSVILPIFRSSSKDKPLLWKDTNLWAQALARASKTSDLVPFVVPLGDLDDMSVISEDNLSEEMSLNILPLLSRYQANQALIIELTVLKDENALKVYIRPFQNKKGFIEELGMTEPINAPMPELLKRAAERTVYLLEQAWREKNAVRFDNPTNLFVRINIQNLAEWIAIRKQLDHIVLIKQYVVKALRKDQAEVEIFYAGELDAFQEALKKEGLFLSPIDENGNWLLRKIADVSPEELATQETPAQQPAEEKELPVISETVTEDTIRTFDPDLYQSVEETTQDVQPSNETQQ
ncbi:MAG: DUF2066 domain-containing protein [Alphaproteobacteria bacterium]|nr:DUF2066 domain-containing protein [Alphaproteobacteria bacterium]